jgi:Uma2 family endonuclease
MSSAEIPEFVNVDDYLAMEERALTKSEYVEGSVRAMSGATVRHNQVAVNCLIHLGQLLHKPPCRPYSSDMKLRIRKQGSTRFYYPDIQIVYESNGATSVYQDSPVVIIEVLSPATRIYDLDEKMTAYLTRSALKCYIVLEQHQPVAIVMRRTDGGFLREQVEGLDATLELPFLGCMLSMRDIYDGIEFTAVCVQEPELEYDLGQ